MMMMGLPLRCLCPPPTRLSPTPRHQVKRALIRQVLLWVGGWRVGVSERYEKGNDQGKEATKKRQAMNGRHASSPTPVSPPPSLPPGPRPHTRHKHHVWLVPVRQLVWEEREGPEATSQPQEAMDEREARRSSRRCESARTLCVPAAYIILLSPLWLSWDTS